MVPNKEEPRQKMRRRVRTLTHELHRIVVYWLLVRTMLTENNTNILRIENLMDFVFGSASDGKW